MGQIIVVSSFRLTEELLHSCLEWVFLVKLFFHDHSFSKIKLQELCVLLNTEFSLWFEMRKFEHAKAYNSCERTRGIACHKYLTIARDVVL